MTPATEINGAGGAYVRRRFTMGERDMAPGDLLTAEQIAAMPRANLNALINTNLIELFPRGPGAGGGQRYAVHIGGGRYHVIEGVQLTTDALSREDADALVNGQTH